MGAMRNTLAEKLNRALGWIEAGLERVFFNARPVWLIIFVLITIALGYKALGSELSPRFDKMIPTSHPYVQHYLEHRESLAGQTNAIRVVIENEKGTIFTAEFLDIIKNVNDDIFFVPGVNRPMMKSIWTPSVQWFVVTAEGFKGGRIFPEDYDRDRESVAEVKLNVKRAGIIGELVAQNFRSAVVYAPLLAQNPDTGEPLNLHRVYQDVQKIRNKYEARHDNVDIHVTGFAMLVGALVEGAQQVMMFFGIALLITLAIVYAYSRCLRSTLAPITASLVAVIWQLGLLRVFGIPLDPYSMLVPFLVFAIGVSHGIQMINGVAHEILNGHGSLDAARRSFRTLVVPGLAALVTDAVGFATLLVIEVPVIQDLALTASLGVAVIVITNIVLLPIILSYTGVSRRRIDSLRADEAAEHAHPVWRTLDRFTRRGPAIGTVAVVLIAFAAALYVSQHLRIGDLDEGAPELRPDAQYNKDARYVAAHYGATTDVFVAMMTTPPHECTSYDALSTVDLFTWIMSDVQGVQSTGSLAEVAKFGTAGINEGNYKWYSLLRDQRALNSALRNAPESLINSDCSLTPVQLYLEDHKADTLEAVSAAAEAFVAEHNTEEQKLLLAAGNAGIQAATNQVIARAQYEMLAWVYGVVAVLCLLTFRSVRALICIFVPLTFTSVLCQALMVWLDIGVKVSTLPVIALGVGIGVDYGIYIFSKLRSFLDDGWPLSEAYFETLKTTGRAVALTGLTLAIGVATWAFSPIKFQADMGILLTFMFLWNMLGALVVIPAVARLIIEPRGPESTVTARARAGQPAGGTG